MLHRDCRRTGIQSNFRVDAYHCWAEEQKIALDIAIIFLPLKVMTVMKFYNGSIIFLCHVDILTWFYDTAMTKKIYTLTKLIQYK